MDLFCIYLCHFRGDLDRGPQWPACHLFSFTPAHHLQALNSAPLTFTLITWKDTFGHLGKLGGCWEGLLGMRGRGGTESGSESILAGLFWVISQQQRYVLLQTLLCCPLDLYSFPTSPHTPQMDLIWRFSGPIFANMPWPCSLHSCSCYNSTTTDWYDANVVLI